MKKLLLLLLVVSGYATAQNSLALTDIYQNGELRLNAGTFLVVGDDYKQDLEDYFWKEVGVSNTVTLASGNTEAAYSVGITRTGYTDFNPVRFTKFMFTDSEGNRRIRRGNSITNGRLYLLYANGNRTTFGFAFPVGTTIKASRFQMGLGLGQSMND